MDRDDLIRMYKILKEVKHECSIAMNRNKASFIFIKSRTDILIEMIRDDMKGLRPWSK